MRDPVMTTHDVMALIEEQFPQATRFGAVLESVGPGTATLRLPVSERNLRPGGTVSGPTMMTLADTAFYFALLAHVGPELLAVTTHLSIDFMRKPPPGDLIADVTLHKVGRQLAVGHVLIRSAVEGTGPVAQASVTYSIPPAH